MSNSFSPEQIQEILDIYFENFAHRQYIGARYVPIFGRKNETSFAWDNSAPYEPLTIVTYEGNSYTSRKFVPADILINNTEYWVQTGNYNAQIEQYRIEVQQLESDIENIEQGFDDFKEEVENDFDALKAEFEDDFDNFKAEIEDDFEGFKTEIEDDLVEVRADIDEEIEAFKDEFSYKDGCFVIGRDTSTDKNALFAYFNNELRKVYQYNWLEDSSAVFKIGNFYYFMGNNTYKYTQDLLHWTDGGDITTNPFVNDGRIWACTLCDGSDHVYCLGAFQYEEDRDAPTPFDYNSYYFRIMYCTVVVNDDGTLTFNEFEPLAFGNNQVNGKSYIDPYMIYSPEHGGYILAVKNELESKIEIYNGSLANLQNTNIKHNGFGLEAPQIVKNSNLHIDVFAHAYSICGTENTLHTDRRYPQAIVKFNISSYDGSLFTNHTKLLEVIKTDTPIRHPGFCKCDEIAYKTIMQIGLSSNKCCRWIDYLSDSPVYMKLNSAVPYADGESELTHIPIVNIPGLQFRYANNNNIHVAFDWVRMFDFADGCVDLLATNGINTRGANPGKDWYGLTSGDTTKIVGYYGSENAMPYYNQHLNCGVSSQVLEVHALS